MTTALSIINRAAEIIGYKDAAEPLDGTDADNFLGVLNALVDAWALDSLFVYATAYQVQSVSGNPVAIGTGAAINIERPERIADGGFFRLGTSDRAFRMIDREEYAEISQKSTSGQPRVCYYEATLPTGNLYFWPALAAPQELHLPVDQRVAQFADLETDYVLPRGTTAALQFSLAEELAHGRRMLDALTVRRAANLRRSIRSSNISVPQLDSDLAPHCASSASVLLRA